MENTITDHQTVLMELWYVFDSICARSHIKYQLYAGSALGAVRHHGIIPWDDDLDVMSRRIIGRAQSVGGRDDLSVILVRVEDYA